MTETGEATVKVERSVEVRKLAERAYEVIVYVLVGSARLREMVRIGITSAERAEQVASEYRQQLGIEDSPPKITDEYVAKMMDKVTVG